jgi:hypothetical protein
MPADDGNPKSSYADRLLAMMLLRENMFYSNPTRYSFSDIAEDLPGAARAVAPVIKNVLPSATIISQDPEKRRQQIAEALGKVQEAKKSKKGLLKEILHNATHMGAGAFLPSFLLSSAINLGGFRPIKTKNIFGRTKYQSPTNFKENFKKLLSDRKYAKHVAMDSLNEAGMGAGLGALAGTAYPLIASSRNIPEQALNEAAEVMQTQPYATSLPASELLSVLNPKYRPKSKALDIGLGTGLGALSGATAGAVPTALKALLLAGKNVALKKSPLKGIAALKGELARDLRNSSLVGAGTGLLSGAITDNPTSDET